MFVTPRLLMMVGLGIVPVLFLGRQLNPWLIATLYSMAVIFLYLADWRKIPPFGNITLERVCEEPLSLGATHVVRILARNRTAGTLDLVVRDEVPGSFLDRFPTLAMRVLPWSETWREYEVFPTRRGDFELGDLWVRIQGPLGLAVRQARIARRKRVKVYPNIRNLAVYDLVIKRGKVLEVGQRPLRRYGQGSDFESLRDYTPDDDYRHMNWKATARRGKPIVQQYQEEKNQNVMIFLDAGRLMTAQVGNLSRLDHALNAALLISYVACQHGDNVGLLVFSDDVHVFVPPKKGKAHVQQILEHLYNVTPALVEPDFAKALQYFSLKVSRRSLLVVLTDLMEAEMAKPLVAYLTRLSRRHLGLVAMTQDTDLRAVADSFPQSAEDVYRKAVASGLMVERERIARLLEQSGLFILDVPPRELTGLLIQRYLEVKARGKL